MKMYPTDKEMESKPERKKMSRRDFLTTAGVVLLSGKTLFDVCSNQYEKSIKDKIYNEYPKYQHLITTEAYESGAADKPHKQTGCSIIIDDKVVTAYHVVDLSDGYVSSPFGPMQIKRNLDKQIRKIYGVECQEKYMNETDDVAILSLPTNVSIKNRFTIDDCCFDEPRLGDEVYVVGNPGLEGVNIRQAYVSDINSIHDRNDNPNFFGVNVSFVGGDSGSFTVNKNGMIMGINSFVLGRALGYSIKMNAYAEHL